MELKMTPDIRNPEFIKKVVIPYIESNRKRIQINENLFDIYEGALGGHIKDKLKKDLPRSWEMAVHRKAPINIFQRIILKLAKIYQQAPRRAVINGNENDAKILKHFEEILDFNNQMNNNNELLETFQNSLLRLAQQDGKPFIRSIPSNEFLIMNLSPVDKISADMIILFMDPEIDANQTRNDIYWLFTDEQFAIIDSKATLRLDLEAKAEQDGTMPVDKKPFIYTNKSKNLIMPVPQEDQYDLAVLYPILLTDLNYAHKYNFFSLLYTIDMNVEDITRAPDTVINFKTDRSDNAKSAVGTVDINVDIEGAIKSFLTQLTLWMETKGMKAGSVGDMDASNVASGVAKLIDESDTTEARNAQASIYKNTEREFWDLLLKKYYPFWVDQGLVANIGTFSESAYIETIFIPSIPLYTRGDMVKDLQTEHEAGFITRKDAIKTLNPSKTDEEIIEYIEEIDSEEGFVIASENDNVDQAG
jgi:hypothetical protein